MTRFLRPLLLLLLASAAHTGAQSVERLGNFSIASVPHSSGHPVAVVHARPGTGALFQTSIEWPPPYPPGCALYATDGSPSGTRVSTRGISYLGLARTDGTTESNLLLASFPNDGYGMYGLRAFGGLAFFGRGYELVPHAAPLPRRWMRALQAR